MFCGIIPLYDSVIDGTIENIQKIQKLNIKTTIIAGDQMGIVKYIASNLSIGDRIFNAEIFNNDNTSVQREFTDSVLLYADGYAEVYPEHKFTLIKLLQRKNKKIGITGGSIFDAPALKMADVGLAAFGATDAAKTASDIIYHKPGLNPIIQSITRARKIFQRSETYCIYRMCCSYQLLLFFFISVVGIDPSQFSCSDNNNCDNIPNTSALPVLTLVIIALLNDGTMISIAYDKPELYLHPAN